MKSPEITDWVFDYALIEDFPVPGGDLPSLDLPVFTLSSRDFTASFRFLELNSILNHGTSPKIDKSVILGDAVRMILQLRDEAQKLKESNENFLEKINEMKAEKNELRDEKQRLKEAKDNLKQKMKTFITQPSFLPHPSAFSAPNHVVGAKFVPVIGYPGVSMWKLMPQGAIDTSQDHVLRPPVA
ncbi:transcription factor ILR3-like isoform X4 [Cucurbita pepo subsp. pepo]|uniref:transcription factor ILR3-like isoform X4 n=1 Tax=Cucurbita pepo subsp. pepo TaxID=3664 RepID=UPI000C9D8FB5|nr:transcription factor ILR3-like isoform X4 [Cucurbita pepo subsp. pepo]